jgi:hypothetical protein
MLASAETCSSATGEVWVAALEQIPALVCLLWMVVPIEVPFHRVGYRPLL